jgi:hypothetical protein
MNLIKEVKDLYNENYKKIGERNQRRHQKTERSPMIIDWQNQHCENDYTAEVSLHVQCNPHQNSNDILQRGKKSTLKFIGKHKRP